MVQASSAEPIELAVTVDDLYLWDDVPFAAGYDPRRCSRSLIEAFAEHGVSEVYAFSCTHPTERDPSLLGVLDDWCAAGHHVGSHTHLHCSCNWVAPATYLDDVDRADAILEDWLAAAPTRFFRHAFGHSGDTPEKVIALGAGLARRGFRLAPITSWFYDVQFLNPYTRAIAAGDQETATWLRDRFVETALTQFRRRADAARAMFGRVPAQVGLVHGSAIAAYAYGRVLEGLAAEGVRFVTLERALQDPVNLVEPTVTRRFRDHMQKWSEASGVPMEGVPPIEDLDAARAVCPMPGLMEHEVFGAAVGGFTARIDNAQVDFADMEVL